MVESRRAPWVCVPFLVSACLSATPVKKDAGPSDGPAAKSDGSPRDVAADTGGGGTGGVPVDAPVDRTPSDVVLPPAALAVNNQFGAIYDGIIKTNCSPCHTTVVPRKGMLDMGDPMTAITSLTSVMTMCATATPKLRVVPGSPDDSYVIKKLTGAPGICGARMPFMCVEAGDGGAPDAVADAVAEDAAPDAEGDAGVDAGGIDGRRLDGGKLDVRPPDALADAAADAEVDAGPPRACLGPDSIAAIRSWILTGAKIGKLLVNDGLNASMWSIEGNLQAGMTGGTHPWSDYPATYIAAVDPAAMGLVGKTYVKVAANSKRYDAGPQAVLTLTAQADVYLIVDDRWGASPTWLTGWADTGWNFTVWENTTRPNLAFSLYKKTAPAGDLALPPIGANNAYDYFIIVD
jgi:hypothetical protein